MGDASFAFLVSAQGDGRGDKKGDKMDGDFHFVEFSTWGNTGSNEDMVTTVLLVVES